MRISDWSSDVCSSDLDEIAAKLKAIIDEHGPEAVAVYPGNGNLSNPLNPVMGAMFIMAMGTYPDRFFSVQTIDQAGKVIAQALHGRWMAGPNAFASSETWIVVGTNPVISKKGKIGRASCRERVCQYV